MRFASSFILGALLTFFASGCEEAAVGARCENVYDCDRTGAGSTRGCYSYANPSIACPPGSGNSCVCCPVPAMRTNLSALPAACMPRGTTPTDVPSVGVDASDSGDAQSDSGEPVDSGVNDVPSMSVDVPNAPRDVPNIPVDVPNAPVDVPNAPMDVPDIDAAG